jgi:hypothetical protein
MPIGWEDEKTVITKADLQKILPKSKLPAELGANAVPREDLNISNYTWQDWFRNYIADPLRGFARMPAEGVGGTAGSLIPGGTIPGAIVGGTVADQLWQNTIGRISPRTFGGPSPNFGESLKTSALESAADVGFNKIPVLNNFLKKKAINKFFPADPNVPIKDALLAAPSDLKPTIANATQNKLAQYLESVAVPEGVRDIRRYENQQVIQRMADELSTDITRFKRSVIPSAQELAQVSSTSANTQFKAINKIKNDLYTTAKDEIESSTASGFRIEPPKPSTLTNPKTGKLFPTGPPQLVPTSLVGPVNPKNTIQFSNTLLDDIDKFIADPNNSNYQIPEVQLAINALRNKVETFVKGNLVDANYQPVMNYATAKADKDELSFMLSRLPANAQSRLRESVRAVRNALSGDIKDSSVNWNPDAKLALDRATEYHRQNIVKTYGPTIAKKLAKIGKYTDDPDIIEENILQMGLHNSTVAEEIVNASGTKQPLANEYIKKFFDAMTNANDEMVGVSGVDYLRKTKEISTKFLTADQRSALDIFARTVQAVTPIEKATPMTSILFRAGYMVASVGSGLIAGNITGSAATGSLILATAPWAKGALSKMMMSPANARLAAKLPRLAAGSPEAQSIWKSLFKTGLKGVRFELQTATGEGLGMFEPHEDGKLHPVNEITPITSLTNVNLNLKQIGWE